METEKFWAHLGTKVELAEALAKFLSNQYLSYIKNWS